MTVPTVGTVVLSPVSEGYFTTTLIGSLLLAESSVVTRAVTEVVVGKLVATNSVPPIERNTFESKTGLPSGLPKPPVSMNVTVTSVGTFAVIDGMLTPPFPTATEKLGKVYICAVHPEYVWSAPFASVTASPLHTGAFAWLAGVKVHVTVVASCAIATPALALVFVIVGTTLVCATGGNLRPVTVCTALYCVPETRCVTTELAIFWNSTEPAVGKTYMSALASAGLLTTVPVSLIVTEIILVENVCAGTSNSPFAPLFEKALVPSGMSVLDPPGSYVFALSAASSRPSAANRAANKAPVRVSATFDVPRSAVTKYAVPSTENRGLNASAVAVVMLVTLGAVSTDSIPRGVTTVTLNVVVALSSADVYVNPTVAGFPPAPAVYVSPGVKFPPPAKRVSDLGRGTLSALVPPPGFAMDIVSTVETAASRLVLDQVTLAAAGWR